MTSVHFPTPLFSHFMASLNEKQNFSELILTILLRGHGDIGSGSFLKPTRDPNSERINVDLLVNPVHQEKISASI